MVKLRLFFFQVTADQIQSVYDKLNAKNDQIVRYVLDVTNSSKMELALFDTQFDLINK